MNHTSSFPTAQSKQKLYELIVSEFLPYTSANKLPGLCRTQWVDRHTCSDVFLEKYEALVTFLDAILLPYEYPQLAPSNNSWNWDAETKVKAQGLKAALSSFQTIAIINKNVLDESKEPCC